MRTIKLNGREATVVRALGFGAGLTGIELVERTNLAVLDLAEVLTALISAGFAECTPIMEPVDPLKLATTQFEVNPAYVRDLKAALGTR